MFKQIRDYLDDLLVEIVAIKFNIDIVCLQLSIRLKQASQMYVEEKKFLLRKIQENFHHSKDGST